MTADEERKRLWDLGYGGRSMDVMYGLFFGLGALGGVSGALLGDALLGAGVGASAGFIIFVALVVWAHRDRWTPRRRH
jgi:hypothetical protein